MLRTNDSMIPPQAKLGEYVSSEAEVPYASDRSSSIWWLVLVALAAALLCAPFFRMLFFLGDEGTVLHAAELILQGKKIYADFFQFLPPGGVAFTAAWFSIAGVSFGSARTLALLTMVGIACFTFLACRQTSRNAPLSAFLAVAWVMMSAWPWMQVSHHWFAAFLSTAAAWAAFVSLDRPERRLRWPLIAGVAAGAAAMFVPHSGALTMLAAMTAFLNLRQNRAEAIAYVLGCALAPAGALAYLLAQRTLAPAYDDIVRFTTTRYLSVNLVRWAFNSARSIVPLNMLSSLPPSDPRRLRLRLARLSFGPPITAQRRVCSRWIPVVLSAPRHHPYFLLCAIDFAIARDVRDAVDPIMACRLSLRRRGSDGRALLAFCKCLSAGGAGSASRRCCFDAARRRGARRPLHHRAGFPGTSGKHRGDPERRRLFLLPLRCDAAIPDCARGRIEI